jgi:hypothetical protein
MQPHTQRELEALSPAVKQPGFEGNRLAPHYAEVKTAWSCTSPSWHVAQLGTRKIIFYLYGTPKNWWLCTCKQHQNSLLDCYTTVLLTENQLQSAKCSSSWLAQLFIKSVTLYRTLPLLDPTASILILSIHVQSLWFRFSIEKWIWISLLSHMWHLPQLSDPPWLWHPNKICLSCACRSVPISESALNTSLNSSLEFILTRGSVYNVEVLTNSLFIKKVWMVLKHVW